MAAVQVDGELAGPRRQPVAEGRAGRLAGRPADRRAREVAAVGPHPRLAAGQDRRPRPRRSASVKSAASMTRGIGSAPGMAMPSPRSRRGGDQPAAAERAGKRQRRGAAGGAGEEPPPAQARAPGERSASGGVRPACSSAPGDGLLDT